MEAGIEHLGRATCKAIDALLVVVEPGRRSAKTAHTVQRMAGDIGVDHVFLVANKVRSDDDLHALTEVLPKNVPLLGAMRYNSKLVAADLEGRGVDTATGELLGEVAAIRQALVEHCREGNPA
jgi:CO dehydrogenase maturation factor